MDLGLSALPFFCSSVRKFSRDFSYNVVHDRVGFSKKNCPKNGENGPKIGFFEFIGKYIH